MRRLAIGIALATVVTYFFGFLYWGASSLPYTAWRQAADDAAAQATLRTHFPERGTYLVPGRDSTELYRAGPVAMVHMLAPDGREPLDTGVMVRGFALVLAYTALLAVLVIDLGDYVWWTTPGDWKLAQAIYNFGAIAIPGLIVARFAATPGGAR